MTRSAVDIQTWCVDYLSGILGVPPGNIELEVDFDRHGLDSALAVAMVMDLEELIGIGISPSVLFEHPNIAALAVHLSKLSEQK